MASVSTLNASFDMGHAVADDMMEFSTEGNHNLSHDDGIDIDIDLENATTEHHEDEEMIEDEDGLEEFDDEMIDDEPSHFPEDEIIEDVPDYDLHQAELLFDDEELVDAEEAELLPAEVHHHFDTDSAFASAHLATITDTETSQPATRNELGTQSEHDVQRADDATEAVIINQDATDIVATSEDTEEAKEDVHQINEDTAETHQGIIGGYETTTEASTAGQPERTKYAVEEKVIDAVVYDETVIQIAADILVEDNLDEDQLEEPNSEPLPAIIEHTSGEADEPANDESNDGLREEISVEETSTSNVNEDQSHGAEQLSAISDNATDSSEAESQLIHKVSVHYQDMEMLLFAPHDEEEEAPTYLLAEHSLAYETVHNILSSCRQVLGESIDDSEELELSIPSLELVFTQADEVSSTVSLVHIASIYSQLQQNERIDSPEFLTLFLRSKEKQNHRLSNLYNAIAEGKGLSQVCGPISASSVVADGALDNHEAESSNPKESHYVASEPSEPSAVVDDITIRPGTPPTTNLSNPKDLVDDTIDFESPARPQKSSKNVHVIEEEWRIAHEPQPSDSGEGEMPETDLTQDNEEEDSHSSTTLQEQVALASPGRSTPMENPEQVTTHDEEELLEEEDFDVDHLHQHPERLVPGEAAMEHIEVSDGSHDQEPVTNPQGPSNDGVEETSTLDEAKPNGEIDPTNIQADAVVLDRDEEPGHSDDIYDNLEDFEDDLEPTEEVTSHKSVEIASLSSEDDAVEPTIVADMTSSVDAPALADVEDEITFDDVDGLEEEDSSDRPATVETGLGTVHEVPASPGSLKRPWLDEGEIETSHPSPSDAKRSRSD